MIHFMKTCGVVGFLILSLTVALAMPSILVACFAKGRRALGALALAALLPFGLGLVGTALGYSRVASVRDAMESPDPVLIEHGRSQARCTSYLGAGCTLLLLAICGIGTAAKGRAAEPAARP